MNRIQIFYPYINKTMKIALVRPNYETHLITPPLGIGYISSFLKEEWH